MCGQMKGLNRSIAKGLNCWIAKLQNCYIGGWFAKVSERRFQDESSQGARMTVRCEAKKAREVGLASEEVTRARSTGRWRRSEEVSEGEEEGPGVATEAEEETEEAASSLESASFFGTFTCNQVDFSCRISLALVRRIAFWTASMAGPRWSQRRDSRADPCNGLCCCKSSFGETSNKGMTLGVALFRLK